MRQNLVVILRAYGLRLVNNLQSVYKENSLVFIFLYAMADSLIYVVDLEQFNKQPSGVFASGGLFF